MSWIESHQSLSRHRKTIRAAKILGCDRHKLIGHLHELWWWALDNAEPNGALPNIGPEDLSEAAGYRKPGFTAALIDAGFVDESEDGSLSLHNWYDYAGKLNDRRAAARASNAERQRRRRYRQRDGNADVTRDKRDENVTVTTLPNQPTNHTNQPTPKAPSGPLDRDDGFKQAVAALERIGAPLRGTQYDDIGGMLDEGAKPDWFDAACAIAARNGVSSWSYVRKILDGWIANGGPPALKPVPVAAERQPAQHGEFKLRNVWDMMAPGSGNQPPEAEDE